MDYLFKWQNPKRITNLPIKNNPLKVKPKERIILGIDPGTSITGYGVIKTSGVTPELITIGSIDLSNIDDHYLKLKHIFERTIGIIDEYHPDELAIEAPFFGKNVQSMLKVGRAQGAAIAAALTRSLPIFEYAPRKDQNVDHRPGSCIKGTGSFHADEYFKI